MHEKVKKYIEKHVNFYEPVYHVFEIEIDDKGVVNYPDYQTMNDIDRKTYFHDEKTTQDFDDWEDMLRTVKKRVLK